MRVVGIGRDTTKSRLDRVFLEIFTERILVLSATVGTITVDLLSLTER